MTGTKSMDENELIQAFRKLLEANRPLINSSNQAVSTAGLRIAAIAADLLLELDPQFDQPWTELTEKAATADKSTGA